MQNHARNGDSANTIFMHARTGITTLLLTGSLVIAGAYASLNLVSDQRFGLGWSIRPGFAIVVATIVLSSIQFAQIRSLRVFYVASCFFGAMFLEYTNVSDPIEPFVGIALALTGMSILFSRASKTGLSEVLFFLLGSYIESVWIYNLCRQGQRMFFFKAGWTA
jgi:hypothetical protein